MKIVSLLLSLLMPWRMLRALKARRMFVAIRAMQDRWMEGDPKVHVADVCWRNPHFRRYTFPGVGVVREYFDGKGRVVAFDVCKSSRVLGRVAEGDAGFSALLILTSRIKPRSRSWFKPAYAA